jgi:DNA-binding NarL/FixJ family response regulator
MIRALVVDDQALVRGGFRLILESQPDIEVVGEAADGQEALTLCRELLPDVVLMDVRMPGMDGLEATRHLLASDQGPRVLMLTTFDLDQYVYDAMRAGASGFLLKDVRPEQLAQAVREAAAGETLLAPTITERLVQQFVKRPRPGTTRPQALETLTERELAVFTLMARGRSNGEIAPSCSSARPP